MQTESITEELSEVRNRHLSHRGDPETSKEAAEKLSPEDVSLVKAAIIQIIGVNVALAPFQVADIYKDIRESMGWPVVKYDSIHKRISDLKKNDHILEVALDGEDKPLRVFTGDGGRAQLLRIAS